MSLVNYTYKSHLDASRVPKLKRDRKKAMQMKHDRLVAAGICIRCGKREAAKGLRLCDNCKRKKAG